MLIPGVPEASVISLYLAVREVVRGRRVLYLDAANSFNPYRLTRVLHRRRLDRSLLGRVRISRAFTAYQLEALVRERLGPVARMHDADTVLLSDVGALLYDEDLPLGEAKRVAASIVRGLRRLDGPDCRVVMGEPHPGRERLFDLFRHQAARMIHVRIDSEAWPWDARFPPLPRPFRLR